MPSNLDWIAILGIVGSVASVAGLVYAFVLARQAQHRKLLAYEVTHPLPPRTSSQIQSSIASRSFTNDRVRPP